MLDPYSVLGVSRDADDTEVKKAYRNLSKQYHPDNNIDNPNKAQAEEKFKNVQAAYEQIMRERKDGVSYDYDSFGSGSYGSYSDFGFGDFGFRGFGGFDSDFGSQSASDDKISQDLKSAGVYINNGYYDQALNVLNSMEERNDVWYYYSAIANMGMGNNVTALEHAKTACSLDPSNYQYNQLVESIEQGNMWYTGRTQNYSINPFFNSTVCMRIGLCLAINLFCGGGGYCCFGPGVYFY